ncbi:hypothetical protein [Frankia nepalensis]|uniref:hypothetical protein n=1 Tax=Frankia nepalensis TaxID=1836974 RepID=UPI0027DB9BBF|nr:hypothetical protein [Frankia nepalensis]
MRRLLTLALVVGGLILASITPASGAETIVTFTLGGGNLTISAPATATLGSVQTGTPSLGGSLGNIVVTDARGTNNGSWMATVYGTNFVTGGGTPAETITLSNIRYASLTGTATGSGTFTAGQANAGFAALLGSQASPLTAYTATNLFGNNSVTWNPTLIVNIPTNAVAGTYQGTLVHNVA